MVRAVAVSDCRLVVMHALSIPADPALTLDPAADPVAEVTAFFDRRRDRLHAAGIGEERLVFDPGIGFGKSRTQSLALLARAGVLAAPYPLLIGHSRKSFLSLFDDAPAAKRDALTLAFSAVLALANVAYLRVHAVAEHRRMLAEMAACH